MTSPPTVITWNGQQLQYLAHGVTGAVYTDSRFIYKVQRLDRREYNREVEFAVGNSARHHLLRLVGHQIVDTKRDPALAVFSLPAPVNIDEWSPKARLIPCVFTWTILREESDHDGPILLSETRHDQLWVAWHDATIDVTERPSVENLLGQARGRFGTAVALVQNCLINRGVKDATSDDF